MSSLNAAMGLSQLPHLFQRNEDRRKVFERYRDAMGDKCSYQSDTKLRQSNRWLSAFVFADSKYKNLIANNLKDYSIETRPLWKPCIVSPYSKNWRALQQAKRRIFFIKGLCLPSSFRNSDEQTRVLELLNV
jgi:pyridoxal phosphate-dependent aminotransferase EpsN